MTQGAAALVRGRERFERRDWDAAFDDLRSSDQEQGLAPEDLERLGEAARWSRHYDEMFDAFERAAAAYEATGDGRSAARVAVSLTIEHYARHADALAAGWIARARRLLEDEPPCREQGLVLMCLSQALFAAGDTEHSGRMAEELIELGRSLGDRDVESLGLLVRGHSLLLDGSASEGTALIDEAMASALGGDLELWTTGQIFCSTIFACRNRGDWARAGEWSVASLRWCERQSVSGFPGLCRFHRAEVLRFRGELERAERDALEGVEELLGSAPRWAGWGLHELGEVRRRRGDLDGAGSAFRQSAELGFDPQPGLALLRLEERKAAAAKRAIAESLAYEGGLEREGRWLVLPAAVEIGIAAGDPDLARSARDELEVLAEKLGTAAVAAAAALANGRVALAESRHEDAAADLRRAERIWSGVEIPYEAAQSRELLAHAYRALGDPDAAELELVAARAVFDRIGAERDVRRLDELLAPGDVPRHTAVRTFMFTDIVDSTRLVELLGDDEWESLLTWHDRTLRECFKARAGEEVGHEGDGFFVAFGDAESALDCACSIQRALRDHRRDHGFAPRVRIGVHTAEATDRGGDYGGRGVHAAARVGAVAEGGQIVASREALEAAGTVFQASDERSLTLKGLSEPVTVATVDWAGG